MTLQWEFQREKCFGLSGVITKEQTPFPAMMGSCGEVCDTWVCSQMLGLPTFMGK